MKRQSSTNLVYEMAVVDFNRYKKAMVDRYCIQKERGLPILIMKRQWLTNIEN